MRKEGRQIGRASDSSATAGTIGRIATVLVLFHSGWVSPADAQQGTAPPIFCGKTYVFSKAVPDGQVVANQATTVTVETYHFLDLINHLSLNCPPPPYTVTMSASLSCSPGPSSGPTLFGPFPIAEDVKTVIPIDVPIPAGPPRQCDLIVTSRVTLGDGSQISQTADQTISVVEAAPGNPAEPIVKLELLGGGTVYAHPGDGRTFTYVLTNNHVLPFTGTLNIDMRNVADRPANIVGPDNTAEGVFSVLDPGGANQPVIAGLDSGAPDDCLPVTFDTIYVTNTLISGSVLVPPTSTVEVPFSSRWWSLTGDGAATESTAVLSGAFSDSSPAGASAGCTYVCDHDEPPDYGCIATSGRAATAVASSGPNGPAAGFVADASQQGNQPFQVDLEVETANIVMIVNGNPVSSGTTQFTAVIHVDDDVCSRNDEISLIAPPRPPPTSTIQIVTPINVRIAGGSLANYTQLETLDVVDGLPTGYANKHPYAQGIVTVTGEEGFDPAIVAFTQQWSAVGVEAGTFNQRAMTNLGINIQFVSPTRYIVTTTWTATNPGVTNFIGFDVISTHRCFAYPMRRCQTLPGDANDDSVVNGMDIKSYIDCRMGINYGASCGCADMDFDNHITDDDSYIFVATLLGAPQRYELTLAPVAATITTDAGEQPAMVEGEMRCQVGAPDASGNRPVIVDELILGTTSAATSSSDTGGMTYLLQMGSGSGNWNLVSKEFVLTAVCSAFYPLADDASNQPPPVYPPNHVDLSAQETWSAGLTATAEPSPGTQSVRLNGSLLAGVISSITNQVTSLAVPINDLDLTTGQGEVVKCPPELACKRRQVCLQPVFVRDSDGMNPAGTSFTVMRDAANAVWAKCCVELIWQTPMFRDNTSFKIIENSDVQAGMDERKALRDTVDQRGENDCIEVFFVKEMREADGDAHAYGDGVASASGSKHAKIIIADAAIEQCPSPITLLLAHEIGHALNLDHPPDVCIMTSSGIPPNCGSNPPDTVSLSLTCKMLRSPLLKVKQPEEPCCKESDCFGSGE